MSAAAQLQGLFPIGDGPRLPKDLLNIYTVPPFKDARANTELGGWALPFGAQIRPIHAAAKHFDPLLRAHDLCPNFESLYTDYWQQDEQKGIISGINDFYADTFREFNDILNLAPNTVNHTNVLHLYDVLQSDLYSGRPLPQNITREQASRLYELANLY
jgi:hypothetical protein